MSVRDAGRLRFPLLAALLAMAFVPGCHRAKTAPPAAGPPVVMYALPVSDEVTDYEEFTGRTDAVKTVEVRARVTGYLEKLYFKDGTEVDKDALLFLIDPRPYEAAEQKAEAALAQAQAHEKRLEADNRRYTALYARGTVSREEFDRVTGDYSEAREAVRVAEAELRMAKLNLSYTKVTASIAGRLSRRMVDPGNLVKADDTMLTTIVALDPMYVYFDVDERTLLRIRRLIREGRVQTRSEGEVPIQAAMADEVEFPHRGTIDFSENRLDPNTGTLRVRGVIDNPLPRVLSPGLFLRVRLPIGRPHKAVLIAEQALGTDQGRKFLYVINRRDEVIQRVVKVGPLVDGRRVIEEGLKPGERVIVRGLQRVRPGIKVAPKPDEQLAALQDPKAKGGGSSSLKSP